MLLLSKRAKACPEHYILTFFKTRLHRRRRSFVHHQRRRRRPPAAMSSPPMEFPSSDIDMQQNPPSDTHSHQAQGEMHIPPSSDAANNPLFLGTPSATPVRGSVAARRALGLSTPRRAPGSGSDAQGSSPMLAYPSSSPVKARAGTPGSGAAQAASSDPLQFPS